MLKFELRAYINVKRSMIRTAGYVPACAAVFDDLLHQQKSAKKFTHIRQMTIAARTGYSRQWVNKALQWLRANGFVNSLQMGWIPPGKKTRIRGCCKYWIAETPADHAHFRDRFVERWAKRILRQASLRQAQDGGRRSLRQAPLRQAPLRQAQEEARQAGFGGQTGDLPRRGVPEPATAGDMNPAESRCQVEVTSHSTTELYPDILGGAKRNLASPALQRLLKNERWRS